MTADGAVALRSDPAKKVAYGELVAGQPLALKVDDKAVLKKHADYKVVGQSIRRVDIPAKLTGEFTYVHDFRLPGMLHARVLRPDDLGAPLLSFDDSRRAQGARASCARCARATSWPWWPRPNGARSRRCAP